eukprot:gene13715-13832_t
MNDAPKAPRIAALLVGAGTGSRFGAPTAKQFLPLAGKTVIRRAAEALLQSGLILQPVGDPTAIEAALEGLAHLPTIPGGATRQDSVRAGLEALAATAPDIVLVHDAARPVIPNGTIEALLVALNTHEGAIPAVPVADTLKRGTEGVIETTVPRDGLFRAQTPQAFRYALLRDLHSRAPVGATDDASILEAAGHKVALIPGHDDNIKLTWPEDFSRLERIVAPMMEPRVGTGYDVHVLVEGRKLILCGIEAVATVLVPA